MSGVNGSKSEKIALWFDSKKEWGRQKTLSSIPTDNMPQLSCRLSRPGRIFDR